MSTYVDLMNEALNQNNRAQGRPGTPHWLPTRASCEPLVMVEMLVAKYLGSKAKKPNKNSSTRPKVHPLNMTSIFKDYLKSKENILRFDLLVLNQRCVGLLLKVQKIFVEQSPLDYPAEYAGDPNLNKACVIIKEVIEKVGGEEYEKSRSRCFIKGDGTKVVTDSFSTPVEDVIMFSDRAMTS
ncbi:hypothetical protein BDZ45DRAFT_736189 [Acephala macrosclerotiorum]|nr:hypothetical protein BDZ45DRAFT_736189 [Acephala macrosclerotiorum]